MEDTAGALVTLLQEIAPDPKGRWTVTLDQPSYSPDDFIVRRRVYVNDKNVGDIIVKMEEN